MPFEEWWNKEHGSKDLNAAYIKIARSFAREAWNASRENMREYQEHAYCRECERGEPCLDLEDQTCTAKSDFDCQYTAKEFHRWLKVKGYKIIKGE